MAMAEPLQHEDLPGGEWVWEVPPSVDVTEHPDGYEVWTVPANEQHDVRPAGSFTLENILIDVTAPDAGLGIIVDQGSSNWTIKNVGWRGTNKGFFQDIVGMHIKVHTGPGGNGLVENVYCNAFEGGEPPDTEVGGVSGTGGQIKGTGNVIRNTFIGGMANNASYSEHIPGELTFRYCFHWNNVVSQYRPNSDGATVEQCVGYINSPAIGDRPTYAGGGTDKTSRGIWTRNSRCEGAMTVRNSSFYVDPDDYDHGAALHDNGQCGIIVGEGVQVDAPERTRGDVRGEIAGSDPTFSHLANGGGVPLSAEMAARGERTLPNAADYPGMAGGTVGNGGGDGDGGVGDPDEFTTVEIVGSGPDRTDYEFRTTGEIRGVDTGTDDVIEERDEVWIASGFVRGGTDVYEFNGLMFCFGHDGSMPGLVVDGETISPDLLDDCAEVPVPPEGPGKLGTIIPLGVAAGGAVGAWLFVRKRRQEA